MQERWDRSRRFLRNRFEIDRIMFALEEVRGSCSRVHIRLQKFADEIDLL